MGMPAPLTEIASGMEVAVIVGKAEGMGMGVGLAGAGFKGPGIEQALKDRTSKRLEQAMVRDREWQFIYRIIPIK
jgi:hypothetical protein